MYDELSEVDIRKMKEEIEYKMKVVRPKCVQDLQTARAFGDLSENYEYKAAKQELRRVDSRLRYLNRMINTAKVITVAHKEGIVEVFDKVTIEYIEDKEFETIQLMTTLRQDSVSGIISKESPLGKSLIGKKVGDCVEIAASKDYTYHVRITEIQKGSDDDKLPISSF